MGKFSKIEKSLWGLVNEAKRRRKRKGTSVSSKVVQTKGANKPSGSIFFMDFAVS